MAASPLYKKNILLVITGGIAAYKSLDLIRELRRNGAQVKVILTKAAQEFVTPLSVSTLAGEKCFTDLWDLTDESDIGHIRLARDPDLILIAPATANVMAKMAHGLADDLASTCLLATDRPVMIAPAMNPHMWSNVATQENLKMLQSRMVHIIDPETGEMACGETGQGRMASVDIILDHISSFFEKGQLLSGRHAIVTAGPTYEPIDPVRFIGNKSSGKQGYAIAQSLLNMGANVTLITGPTNLDVPHGVDVVQIETAQEMLQAVEKAMPADIAVCAAAIADYGVKKHSQKQKKKDGGLNIQFTENPDILKIISAHNMRPSVVVGFAAETNDVIDNARLKLQSKSCDAIVANHVGGDINPVFGADMTSITWIDGVCEKSHDNILKTDVADLITHNIIRMLDKQKIQKDKVA